MCQLLTIPCRIYYNSHVTLVGKNQFTFYELINNFLECDKGQSYLYSCSQKKEKNNFGMIIYLKYHGKLNCVDLQAKQAASESQI